MLFRSKAPLNLLFRQLQLSRREFPVQGQWESEIVFPGRSLRFSNNPELLQTEVARVFPGSSAGFLRDFTREIDELFKEVQKIGFKTLVLSNNSEKRVQKFLENIDSLYIHDAKKPSVPNYLKSLEMLNSSTFPTGCTRSWRSPTA